MPTGAMKSADGLWDWDVLPWGTNTRGAADRTASKRPTASGALGDGDLGLESLLTFALAQTRGQLSSLGS